MLPIPPVGQTRSIGRFAFALPPPPRGRGSRRLRPRQGSLLPATQALRKEPSYFGLLACEQPLLVCAAWERSATPTAGTKPIYAYPFSCSSIFRPVAVSVVAPQNPSRPSPPGCFASLDGTCRAPLEVITWPENAGLLTTHREHFCRSFLLMNRSRLYPVQALVTPLPSPPWPVI